MVIKTEILIRPIKKGERPPYELLKLADPSSKMINSYLPKSRIFLAELDKEIIGVYVLLSITDQKVEIKNIAVKPEFQGKGLGKLMLGHAEVNARSLNFKTIKIATANSSIAPLHLYLSQGFLLQEIIPDFFIENYEKPIFENGVQCRDLMVLEKNI
jgi:aminoglycoside 6'-N-acetyltransferase I